ncbi:PREDICTED: uncharacterized protein LOC105559665 [Vollenhovia emeryi]|uniref:uncharacterized protein LOC105559665 n=1 Tax=Vollenhovia emeryi TaxID=411798 RepID=UPI0005F4FBB4|nr:PREDICTED: uncharacterized protein LOC105559665 [Vollenhovia emeryi]
MRVEEQTVQVTAAPCKLNPISPTVKHERSQRADNSDFCRKILNETRCFSRQDLSLRSTSVIDAGNVPTTSSETENSGVWKDDLSTSESNVIQQFEYVSWKYKNPRSISTNNHMGHKNSTDTLENVVKEDEPREGRARRSSLINCRDLATYQESCDTPRTKYSFAALVLVMAQATAQSLLALIYVIIKIVSVIKMFSFILKFMDDRVNDIRRSKNVQQVMVKLTIFILQMFGVYIGIIFIFSIVSPIIDMAIAIATKIVTRN